MLGIKIKYSDDNDESSVRPAVVSTEKRTDQWSVLLVSVGEKPRSESLCAIVRSFCPSFEELRGG